MVCRLWQQIEASYSYTGNLGHYWQELIDYLQRSRVKLYGHSHLYNPLASMQDNRINSILDYNGHRFTHTHTHTHLNTVRHIFKERLTSIKS